MMNNKIEKIIITLMLLSTFCISVADDTDIIDQEIPVDSNVLFVMDMSKSMDWGFTDYITPVNPADSRKNILQSSLSLVLTDPTLVDINVGLSSFSGDSGLSDLAQQGHGITYPISPIDADAQTRLNQNPLFSHPGTSYLPVGGGSVSRGFIGTSIPSTWAPRGGTPIVDALYEAALYFRGDAVHFGAYDPAHIRSAHPSTYTGLIQDVTTTSTTFQCNTVSCSGAACNGTKVCTSSPSTNTCSTPSCGSSCTYHTGTSCSTTCPSNTYDEFSNCTSPVTTCSPNNYYSCIGPNVTSCTHSVCGNVTTSTTTTVGSATYNSPINDRCANNAIILLSDGSPSLNNSAADVRSLVGGSYHNNCDLAVDEGRCGAELAKFLANEDNSSGVIGDQFVKTHTIGLALSDPSSAAYLQLLASNGDGQFVNASSAASLAAALKNSITHVSKARSFSSPTYTSSNSSLLHGSSVYLPIFDRGIGPTWTGNLKKYTRSSGKLIDANGNDATDNIGGLHDTAKDFWATSPSTDAIKSGGVANRINPSTRILYTDNGASGTSANLTTLNNSLSNSLFGATITTSRKNTLIEFIKGWEADGVTPRHHLGDIVHSKPVYLSYGGNKVIFVGTNEGYLHAFDENTGNELFAFMPSVLLKNIDIQYDNDASKPHPYGVDGAITLWHDDTNKNKAVDAGETAILYFGLRRGGKSYYALDVSNRTTPNLLWSIKQGGGAFNRLGFSWSPPIISKMKYGGSSLKPVLVFGGGYIDDREVLGVPVETDNGSTPTGADVFIVNATNGSLVWRASSITAPNYAVPSGINVQDVNRDGSIDRIYYADTGGNVWRADFNSSTLSSAKVMLFASLGGVTKRKFFAEPDVAIFKREGKYLASVSIGSGSRPDPLNQDASPDDHFFVMFDKNVLSTPIPAPAVITQIDLVNATGGAKTNALTSGNKGWYIDLVATNGEKVLSKALTYQNIVFFNSFGTDSVVVTACNYSNVNQSRLYALNLINGGPVLDFDTNGTNDKSIKVATGEILSQPQILFNTVQKSGGGSCAVGDCIRSEEISIGKSHSIKLDPDTITGSTNKNVKKALKKPLRRIYWLDKK